MTRDIVTGETRLSGQAASSALQQGLSMFTAIVSVIGAAASVYAAVKSHKTLNEVRELRTEVSEAIADARAESAVLADFVGKEFTSVHESLAALQGQMTAVREDISEIRLILTTQEARAYERHVHELEQWLGVFLSSDDPSVHAPELLNRATAVITWCHVELSHLAHGDGRRIPYIIAAAKASWWKAIALQQMGDGSAADKTLSDGAMAIREYISQLLETVPVSDVAENAELIDALWALYFTFLNPGAPAEGFGERDWHGLHELQQVLQSDPSASPLALDAAPPADTAADAEWMIRHLVGVRDDERVLVPTVARILSPLGVREKKAVDEDAFRILRYVADDPAHGTGPLREGFGLPPVVDQNAEMAAQRGVTTGRGDQDTVTAVLDWSEIALNECDRAAVDAAESPSDAVERLSTCHDLYVGYCDQVLGGDVDPGVVAELATQALKYAAAAGDHADAIDWWEEARDATVQLIDDWKEWVADAQVALTKSPADETSREELQSGLSELSAWTEHLRILIVLRLELAAQCDDLESGQRILSGLLAHSSMQDPARVLDALYVYAIRGHRAWALDRANEVRERFEALVKNEEPSPELFSVRLGEARIEAIVRGSKSARGKVKRILERSEELGYTDVASQCQELLAEIAPQS